MASQSGRSKRKAKHRGKSVSTKPTNMPSVTQVSGGSHRGQVIACEENSAQKLRNAARFADHLAGGFMCKVSSSERRIRSRCKCVRFQDKDVFVTTSAARMTLGGEACVQASTAGSRVDVHLRDLSFELFNGRNSKKRSREAMSTGVGAGAPVTGTSTALEKSYFRLTSAPDPSNVRPPAVLRQSLQHIKRMWAKEENYEFACDQLKSIRQDLTVQGIEDELTVDVYQTHARIALESGDMDEYNQCQSRLKELHVAGVAGVRMDEFTGYRLVYSLYRQNHREVNATMMDLTASQRQGEGVAHALDVVKAYHMGDYCTFFRLYKNAPNMTPYMMDFLVMRMRKHAFRAMVKAYLPTIPLHYIKDQLKFDFQDDLVRFVEVDMRATTAMLKPGEEPAVDVKATRTSWAQQGMS